MNYTEREIATKIMNQLIEHPITKIFHNPINSTNVPKGCDDFNSPYSLLNIQKKLQNNQYNTFTDWKNETELCWANALKFKEKNKHLFAVGEECQKLFNKLTHGTDIHSAKSWFNEICNIHDLELKFSRHPPKKVYQVARQLDAYNQLKDEKIIPFSNGELKAFVQAGNSLMSINSEETNRGLMKILNEIPYIENNSTELFVDVTKLDSNTIQRLRDYMKKQLEKHGYYYPL